jgi:hypothetical protein
MQPLRLIESEQCNIVSAYSLKLSRKTSKNNDQSSSAGIFDCCRSVFLHQGKHTQDAADAGLSLPLIDQLAELADLHSGMFGAPQELRRAQRHFLG